MTARQLHLFKGPRQRGVTVRPRISEFALQCAVADALRVSIDPAWIYTAVPLGEKRDPVTAQRLKRQGVIAGYPDIVLFGPERRVVWLELKRPGGGRLSEVQALRSRQLVERGHDYFCTNDFQEAIDYLADRRIVRMRVSA
jgi:hypothetical protein